MWMCRPHPWQAVLSELISSADLPANLVPELTKMGLSGVGTKAAVAGVRLPLFAAGAGVVLVAVIVGIAFWAVHTAAPAASQQTAGTPTMNTAQAAPQSSNQPIRANGTASIPGLQPGQPDTNPYSQGPVNSVAAHRPYGCELHSRDGLFRRGLRPADGPERPHTRWQVRCRLVAQRLLRL